MIQIDWLFLHATFVCRLYILLTQNIATPKQEHNADTATDNIIPTYTIILSGIIDKFLSQQTKDLWKAVIRIFL